MKKVVLFVLSCILFTMVSCTRNEVVFYQLKVIHPTLTPVETEKITSGLDFTYEFIKDTLRCKISTAFVNKGDTLMDVIAYMNDGNILITANTSTLFIMPDSTCKADSCWSLHELTFDILKVKRKEYSASVSVNNIGGGFAIQ